jgi:hypothetical protein
MSGVLIQMWDQVKVIGKTARESLVGFNHTTWKVNGSAD